MENDNNENKEKMFLIVPLSKGDDEKDLSNEIIWKSKDELNYDFLSLMTDEKDFKEPKAAEDPEEAEKAKKAEEERRRFLLYLKIRTTGCWNIPKDFDKVLTENPDSCYIIGKWRSKIIAIYKIKGKHTVGELKSDKEKQKELLAKYMNLASADELPNDINLSAYRIAADGDESRYRFEVSDCGKELIEAYCKESYNDKYKHIQRTTFKTEEDFHEKYNSPDSDNKDSEDVENYITDLILRGTKQIVLTGAPGTGKTFLAQKIAEKLAKGITLDQPEREDVQGFENQIELVQFHAGYDYSDFVEGLRPVKADNGISFEVKDGIFKAFCRKAANEPDKRFIFIIDEINRADLSKVFGELMYGLEYRGRAFDTQYSHWREEKFYIPENVYIIGTMNDIDRSVETFDFALRRRFMWYEIKASDYYNESVIKSIADGKDGKGVLKSLKVKLSSFAKRVNTKLIEKGENYNITESHKIGPAYFDPYYIYKDVKKGDDISDIKENINRDIWELRIEPVIREYVRGYDNAGEFIGELRNAVLNDNG